LTPGEQLRELRNHLGMTARDVEDYSRRIVSFLGNEEFFASDGWITHVENKPTTPNIYKLFTLSIAYRVKYTDLLILYGVDLEMINSLQSTFPLPNSHLTQLAVYDNERRIMFPLRFSPSYDLKRTTLLSRVVEEWGEIPISLIERLCIHKSLYGYVGLEDNRLFPLIRAGAFVKIDDGQTEILDTQWTNDFDRPIYFVELRDGYACSWCELHGDKLLLLPHPWSRRRTELYAYPNDAEIVGRVTGVAMMIAPGPGSSSGASPALPKLS